MTTPIRHAARLCLALAVSSVSGCAGDNAAKPSTSPESAPSQENTMPHPTYTNQLAGQSSPYLLQHAHNPVNWRPWGDEAFAEATRLNKPVFLSIGYSSCHWCHVMEHESFSQEDVAAILNEHFIAIKVDREERPDVDAIYMTAVQLMTGSGGWPLSVFLTPDRRPFYGGTYFPPDDRYGRPGFKAVLKNVASVWASRQGDIERDATRLTDVVRKTLQSELTPGDATPGPALLDAAMVALVPNYDKTWGGFGGAPKFPPTGSLAFLLRRYKADPHPATLEIVTHTLQAMARGGMYDQAGGGFHRYSVDAQWMVPHFEKMLYDNALLSRVYVEAWQVTGDPFYQRIATEILDYVLRDMTHPEGGFYSAQDADSEGVEGKFYVWSREELIQVLGPDEGPLVADFFGATSGGNFEGDNILHVPIPRPDFATQRHMTSAALDTILSTACEQLVAERSKRIPPLTDDKVISAWNGMMISSMARAGAAFGIPRFVAAAERAAAFSATHLVDGDRLLRSWREGVAGPSGFLDDYAHMANAHIDLYEATFNADHLKDAQRLVASLHAHFRSGDEAGFTFAATGTPDLLAASRPMTDGAIPSGNAIALMAMVRLHRLTGDEAMYDGARAMLDAIAPAVARQPRSFAYSLLALDFMISSPSELVLIGPRDAPATVAFEQAIRRRFLPNTVFAAADPATVTADMLARIPLLRDRPTVDGHPALYFCENFVCRQPVTDVDALSALLGP
ncbi:MAG: thioredoxin domain-containing protein [Lentisphaerae bacterium]|nr:thioredoxin domain-containing protein [Lentisphaerota bacterium]